MSDPIFPPAIWSSGTLNNSVPANDNSHRIEAIHRLVISKSTTAQPLSPSEGDVYIIPLSATGDQWSTFAQNDLAIYTGGTWYAFEPVDGLVVNVAGQLEAFESGSNGGWTSIAAGSTQGKQAIYVSSGAMRPSVSGGCADLAAIASAANQPDIVTLDFDPTTQEYAQFSVVMPEKWDGGTITFKPYWSHSATTTNFGVVWDLQAVAVLNDGAIATNFGTAQTSTDTGGTTDDLYQAPESAAITVGGSPSGGNMIFFRLSRVTGDGADTLAVDARLHGITVYVTTNADTDE
jgi:hypothetical protein